MREHLNFNQSARMMYSGVERNFANEVASILEKVMKMTTVVCHLNVPVILPVMITHAPRALTTKLLG